MVNSTEYSGGGNSVSAVRTCLALSIGLHLVLLGVAARISCEVRYPAPIVVDLSFNSPPSVELPSGKKSGPPAVTPRRPALPESFRQHDEIRSLPKVPTAAPEQTKTAPTPTAAPNMPSERRSNGAIATIPTPAPAPVTTAQPQTAAAPSRSVVHPAPAVTQAAAISGSSSAVKVQQQYLKEHFVYIRNLINSRLVYPPMARKMNWSGRVVVAFTIAEDGTVHELRVIESSGFPVLDRGALDTVRDTAPFPRPPVRAEITVPIQFRMMK